MARSSRRNRDRDSGKRKRSGGFSYRERSVSDVNRRSGSNTPGFVVSSLPSGDDVTMFTPKEGRNRVRFLPATWDGKWFGFDLYVHYGVGPNSVSMTCPAQHLNEECVICNERRKAMDDDDDDYAQKLRFSQRVAYWIVDRNDDDQVKLWIASSFSIDQELGNLCVDPDSGEALPIDHPDEGYDFTFTRTGTGLTTKYEGKSLARKASPICSDERDQEDVLEFITNNPLPECFQYSTSDDVAEAFSGNVRDSDDDDDDDKPSRRSRRSRKSSRDEDESELPTSARAVRRMSDVDLEELIEDHNLDIDYEDMDQDEMAEAVIAELDLEEKSSRRSGRSNRSARSSRSRGRRGKDDEDDDDDGEDDEDEDEDDDDEDDEDDRRRVRQRRGSSRRRSRR